MGLNNLVGEKGKYSATHCNHANGGYHGEIWNPRGQKDPPKLSPTTLTICTSKLRGFLERHQKIPDWNTDLNKIVCQSRSYCQAWSIKIVIKPSYTAILQSNAPTVVTISTKRPFCYKLLWLTLFLIFCLDIALWPPWLQLQHQCLQTLIFRHTTRSRKRLLIVSFWYLNPWSDVARESAESENWHTKSNVWLESSGLGRPRYLRSVSVWSARR